MTATDVGEHPVVVFHGFDGEFFACASGNIVALVKFDAFEHRRATGIDPLFACRRVFNCDAVVIQLRNQAETQLGLTFTHTSLTNGT